jgi:hypothetical protein
MALQNKTPLLYSWDGFSELRRNRRDKLQRFFCRTAFYGFHRYMNCTGKYPVNPSPPILKSWILACE